MNATLPARWSHGQRAGAFEGLVWGRLLAVAPVAKIPELGAKPDSMGVSLSSGYSGPEGSAISHDGVAGRPKLLFLSQGLPYPPDTGAAVRTYNLLRILAAAFDVTFVGFYRERAHRSAGERAESVRALSRLAHVTAHPIPQEHSRVRLAYDHSRSLLSGTAYTRFAYQSVEFRSDVRAALARERFALVHMDSMDLFGYLPLLGDIPVVCGHQNVESELLRRRASVERSAWMARYLRHQARLVERVERVWCPRVALNVTVSDRDRDALRTLAPSGRYAVAPNGVDVETFRPTEAHGTDGSIVFLGGTEWFPNLDAVTFFCQEVLPLLRARGVDAPVLGVGRASAEEQARFAERYGVRLTGYVDDVRPYLARAACTIVPLRFGGGTRLKITTAWATGCAIVSTRAGAEGLEARHGENLLVADDPQAFADAVTAVLDDPGLRTRLGAAGRETAERVYSWEVIGERMLAAYHDVRRAAGASRER